MKTTRTHFFSTLVTLLVLLVSSFASLHAQTIYALADGKLYFFKANNAEKAILINVIWGLQPGHRVVGMDFRPNTGELFALGYNATTNKGLLYTIDLITAEAKPVGNTPLTLRLDNGSNVTFDFNPTVDRIRVMGANGVNYRLNPNNGTITATDGNLRYSSADRNAGRFARVISGAYINNFIGTTATTLYNIEAGAGVLVTQNPPNDGLLNTVGSLGIDFHANTVADLDIFYDTRYHELVLSNAAYLAIGDNNNGSDLYWLNVSNGTTKFLSDIGIEGAVENIAVLTERKVSTRLRGNLIYAVTMNNNLISFDSELPGVIRSLVPISGVNAAQTLVGTDFRPNTGELFGLGYNNATGAARLYIINLQTGMATAVGNSDFNLELGTGAIAFDFNPTVDRIRVEGANGKNYRLNPITGGLAATDGDLKYAAGDVNVGKTPAVGSVAYTNSFIGTTSTTLYVYDDVLNVLATQIPPNDGVLNTIGSSGVTQDKVDASSDLDIYFDPVANTNTAYLTVNSNYSFNSGDRLYTVNLQTGAVTLVGLIGGGIAVRDIAVFINRAMNDVVEGQLIFGWTANNNLITFDSENPSVIRSSKPITGLPGGQLLVGMDFRPATGELWAMSYNRVNGASMLYTLDTATAVLNPRSSVPFTLDLGINASALIFDFNPTVDRIRVMGENGRNYRLNPNTGGIAATDGNLNYKSGDRNAFSTPRIGTGAYTNNFNTSTATTLYDYDVNLNVLATQIPPNDGTLNTLGNSGITINPADPTIDLDIFYDFVTQSNIAYLVANVGNSRNDQLYTVDLMTGRVALMGQIGNGIALANIAIPVDSIPMANMLQNPAVANRAVAATFNATPNPGRDAVRISLDESMRLSGYTLKISDLRGQILLQHTERADGNHFFDWNANALAPGMYLITVTANDGQVATQKWMKQ
ncbi:MAG: DUF4394 domain-containing protein [Saprospiraceae bacterium]